MRGTYGPNQPYTAMAARALQLWARYEKRWKRQFLHRIGVLWMAAADDDSFERESLASLRESKIKFQELSPVQMKKRWPQINFQGVPWGIFEPECGYLEARSNCQRVVQEFVANGGRYRQAAILPHGLEDAPRRSVELSDGSQIKADVFVFACGPWLGQLFPQTIGSLVRATKQEVLFFGTPAGDARFDDEHLPVWGDHRERFFYGIPSSDRRGFKVADDTRGPEFDPTAGERIVSQTTVEMARQYLAFRFPAMQDAPVIESRVCQYEQTPDGNFIIDRHPKMENVWLVGGGSGHGFKHGPAVGEMLSKLISNDEEPGHSWRLSRFSADPKK